MPKLYETVVVIDAMLADEAITAEIENVSKIIQEQGELLKVDRWGKRRMAYEIRRKSHGEYAVLYYHGPAGLPAEIEKRIRLNENILRWLTVADNPAGVPADRPENPEAVLETATERKGED